MVAQLGCAVSVFRIFLAIAPSAPDVTVMLGWRHRRDADVINALARDANFVCDGRPSIGHCGWRPSRFERAVTPSRSEADHDLVCSLSEVTRNLVLKRENLICVENAQGTR
ncbi:hypothetical protein QCM80_45145 [Bradyrhizobium sp. SSUT112]|uniref:hypothetical protein n=1 Tax=Bradyrhizobium sp. SSUT112 TaxID=3040604 RepID=UPI00244CDE68|nr:hypothetical protein [Bradyrhizobium sp. SSUT112]MDH2357658.1 hypothetical protein [Bradyrhizobium sp. SSUT112]